MCLLLQQLNWYTDLSSVSCLIRDVHKHSVIDDYGDEYRLENSFLPRWNMKMFILHGIKCDMYSGILTLATAAGARGFSLTVALRLLVRKC
jgi:hypothetical protein